MKNAWIALLCLLSGLSAAPSLWAETRTIGGVSLRGDFIQGGMVVGQVPDQARVRYGGRQLTLTEQGEFVLGFGRDEPLEHSLQVTLADGRQQTLAFSIEKREYNLQRVEGVPARTVNPDPSHLKRIQEEAGQVKQARDTESDLHGFLQQFTWPVQGPISGVYGSQRFYNGEPRRPHYGVDIAVPQGTEILAPADGVVTLAHEDMFFSGGTMVIDHGHGISTSYLHMSKLLVTPGTAVTQGQVIGLVGATGRATGPHLCWRLNWYQERLDPQLLIPES
ncbi:M23 family metallopeptidase [Ketobacter sp.]|uniref:M23 family metallopeptidase n=1 Tax=Ketobacter sp. TaxID=2083498 RepID=UPI000F2B4E66|nr:M23 family metallopeptidase [Ketobacter sp.]RLT96345.1 MAG: M23 family metallopeptidase [Ketobacter sp.]